MRQGVTEPLQDHPTDRYLLPVYICTIYDSCAINVSTKYPDSLVYTLHRRGNPNTKQYASFYFISNV